MDGRSQIKVHTDERVQVHSAQSSLAITHPSINRARRYLTLVAESPSHRASIGRHYGRVCFKHDYLCVIRDM